MARAAGGRQRVRGTSAGAPAEGAIAGPRRRGAARGRGSVTVWTLLCVPLVLTVLAVMVEVNRLWQARVQLENALEAAALAAVQEWSDRGGGVEEVAAAQAMGLAYARANTIHGVPVELENAEMTSGAAWHFGRVTARGTGYDFRPAPDSPGDLAVLLEARVRVARLLKPLLGSSIGETTVAARVAASYDDSAAPPRPRLIRINGRHGNGDEAAGSRGRDLLRQRGLRGRGSRAFLTGGHRGRSLSLRRWAPPATSWDRVSSSAPAGYHSLCIGPRFAVLGNRTTAGAEGGAAGYEPGAGARVTARPSCGRPAVRGGEAAGECVEG